MKTIINQFIKEQTSYLEIREFSNNPGIYAIFFTGNLFPLDNHIPHKNEIIYIGKTQSSQASRDRDTHFTSGKTGSSTVRRSLGAILREKLKLNPMPRGVADISKGRIDKYKFDEVSEEKLSVWMQKNLALSFYEHSGTMNELDELETQLIGEVTPILNIDWKNPNNQFKKTISGLRKVTGLIAYNSKLILPAKKEKLSSVKYETVKKNIPVDANVHRYEGIWQELVPKIFDAIKIGSSTEIHLGKAPFEAVGNRKSYSFRLEMVNGKVENNIGGSAVARDLARVLTQNIKFMPLARGRKIVIRLDKQFTLRID